VDRHPPGHVQQIVRCGRWVFIADGSDGPSRLHRIATDGRKLHVQLYQLSFIIYGRADHLSVVSLLIANQ
jgi:hypothetical protein